MNPSFQSKTAAAATWDAADYAANSAVQQTWARELIARLNLRGGERILDVGCGDGKVTAEMAAAVPRGSATGIDASPQMIEFAQKAFPPKKVPNLDFRVMDARKIILDHRFDLVFSNAALHWVDDHQAILRGVARVLKRGGRLVVSCGGKGNAQDVFVALRPELRQKSRAKYFRRMPKPYFFYSPEDYEKWLPKCGFQIRRLELVPKDATYAGAEGFAAWLRTTWLPYVQRVPEKAARACRPSVSAENKKRTGGTPAPPCPREDFIAAVTGRYLTRHPPDAEGKVHVRMVRLEIDAEKI